ncbi:CHAT domain-containing protein [Suillus paluster]|uniref:CHAT domain-containing protein n=1 Tax=Suillus paluster TaxID=48578 RepID=UPI001B86F430|nr:CHAT domain-containing protein [Suillus paluster]KAG1730548.1 CHAT domain-containing protein [Suillus paluster]
MPGNLEGQYIKLEVISGKNLRLLSWRIPAGIYVSINVDSRRRWKSAVRMLSSDSSVAWNDIAMILSPDVSPRLTLEAWASFELGRALGNGELIGKLETSWHDMLNHGDEPFVLSFPPIRDVYPSLTLKAAVVHACGNEDIGPLDSTVYSEIGWRTYAAHAQFTRYMKSGSVSTLNDAVEHFQYVLDKCPVGHPDRGAALTNLAWARLQGYIQKDLQDIDSTTSLFHDALALRPQGHPDHPLSLYHLTEALNWRYINQPTPADICESARLYHELLPLCSEGTYLRSIAAGDNGVGYVIRECNNLPTDASDEGIQLRRIVLELCPLGHQHCLSALDKLSRALDSRFTQCGSIDDLNESIQCCRDIISLCPEGCDDRGSYLNNLAYSIKYRFNHQGNSDDLGEVISLYEEALCLHPVGHEFRDVSLDNLGRALRTRFKQCDDINDINRAISLCREALELNPPGNPNRATTFNNLAAALQNRSEKLHDIEDLNEAIDLLRESLQLKQHDHPERHAYLCNLSAALCSHFTESWKNDTVEEAIDLCQQSLAALHPLHPDRSISHWWLQVAYLSRYQVQRNPGDLSLAVENFRLASRHPTQGLPPRIIVSSNWTVVAEQHGHGSALEAYATFFELLDAHMVTRSSIAARRKAAAAFRDARMLPVNAASCALRHHNLQEAVELVEQGRGQQWSLASRLRTPLEDLESRNPNLAHKFLALSKCLSDAQVATGSADRAAADRAAIEYRQLTKEWDTVVAEIRNIQDFSRFLLPPSYDELRVAARNGPVIILIASEYSCDAVIVPTAGQPHHVPFPSLTLAHLEMLKNNFAREIRHAGLMGPTELRKHLRALLRKVWNVIMLPIVNVLQHNLKLRRRSRIWLCPTAAFTSIPLHAAHPFRTKADRSGREPCLEDLYICSYTPTLSALIRSGQTIKMRGMTPSFVAIGQSEPGAGQGTVLPAVDDELKLVHKLIPPTAKFTTLSGDDATRAGALEALQNNTWVHLACHGKQDRKQPYYSNFAMKDKPLTLLDIMDNDAPHAEFAFLSACHTAVGDEEMPDEVIHLAAGMQFSGFKSVIGTLWAVDDAVTKHVVEAFYENMFKEGVIDCTRAASSLNYATDAVKKIIPLEQKIVFIHIGV